MLPRLSEQNTPNTVLANAKLLGELGLGKLGGSDFFDVGLCEFGLRMLFASFVVRAVSAFKHHVSNILGMGSHGEMFRIYARRIVARVHDFHTLWNHPFMRKNPRDSISQIHFPSIMDSELALALLISRCQPQPTIVWRRLLNLTPEANFKFFIKHEGYIHAGNGYFNG